MVKSDWVLNIFLRVELTALPVDPVWGMSKRESGIILQIGQMFMSPGI